MKKTKMLALALVLAIVLMGAGYAYWSETLTINNFVSTGELNVEFVKQSFSIWPPRYKFPNTHITDGVASGHTSTGYATASIEQITPKKTKVIVNNMYPGVWALYDAKFENKGTIPAVIESVTINKIQISEALDKNLIVFGGYVHWKNGALIPEKLGGEVFLCPLEDFELTFNNLLKGIKIEEDEFITFDIPEDKRTVLNDMIKPYDISLIDDENCVNFLLPPTVKNEDGVEGKTVEFDIELNFRQHNEQ